MSVDRAYYVGEGPENDKMLAKAIARAEAVRKARLALVEKYGAKTLMVQGKFVWGIVWDEKQEEKWKHFLREQDGMYCYDGNGRYKLGKQLNRDLTAPGVADHTSEWLAIVLGVRHDVFLTVESPTPLPDGTEDTFCCPSRWAKSLCLPSLNGSAR